MINEMNYYSQHLIIDPLNIIQQFFIYLKRVKTYKIQSRFVAVRMKKKFILKEIFFFIKIKVILVLLLYK